MFLKIAFLQKQIQTILVAVKIFSNFYSYFKTNSSQRYLKHHQDNKELMKNRKMTQESGYRPLYLEML